MNVNPESIVIGVTDCGAKFENYTRWLETSTRQMQIIKLSAALHNYGEVDRCDGVLLTGGGDIHPKFFGKPDAVEELDPKEVDEYRDEFELKIIERLVRRDIPLLGICRGLQVVNIHHGGDIILDLMKFGKKEHGIINDSGDPSQLSNGEQVESRDRMHRIVVEPGSRLQACVRATQGVVNSSHHQAVGRVGKELRSTAWSNDGVIEALESAVERENFLLLVQWHPERLAVENTFSMGVRDGFLDAARQYALAH
ncbi:MAG: gamma-glutamyl-gamma-aminobutyrate hydrolase family protein [Bacteroidota bacterium]